MHKPLSGKRIVLGVSGGIAAYKAADLTSKLIQLGADVHVIMTGGALQFVQPMTFQALTRNPVYTSVFDGWIGDSAGHVTLAATADVVIVAPATASSISRMVMGDASDMLGAVLLATQAPIVIAPAMEHHMWHHAATQANLTVLRERGVTIVPPESGRLASGASGDGRLASPDVLLMAVRAGIGAQGPLAGKRVVVTAGGTHEPIDPVRFIGNGSSGQMGIALARAAVDAGAEVTLILGPTVSATPEGVRCERVTTALQMQVATEHATEHADILIMAAAVADFRPAEYAESKIKKEADVDTQQLTLTRNPDIIAGIRRSGVVKVGFAAETDDLLENARSKLQAKGMSMIVANDAVSTIGASTSRATVITADGDAVALPELGKDELAAELIDRIARLVPLGNAT